MKSAVISFQVLFFSFVFTMGASAQDYSLIKDLRNEWKVYSGDQYQSFSENSGHTRTIYFSVDATDFPGSFLSINSPTPVTFFVNGQLAAQGKTPFDFSIDSLANAFQSRELQISIHQMEIRKNGLTTEIISRTKPTGFGELLSPRYSSFRDFAIVGMLILLIMLIIITQLNPKLAADYFSVTKIFSMREGEDGQAYSRITSSINILFYAYSSLMIGYYLMIIFHFLPAHYPAALSFQSISFWDTILQWSQLSLVVLALFFLKIVMVYGLSFVFGMKEIGGIHFFNWVRLLVGVFGVLTVVLFLYFITHGSREGFYTFLLSTVSWVLAGWMVLIILKLRRQLEHSLFHLFSYICATELIPFLITIKVLYY